MHDVRRILAFTAVTASGQAFDIEFPLHPGTRSAEGVSQLLTALLDTISKQVENRGDLSDGDVLQALAMAAAIRARTASPEAEAMRRLFTELVATAMEAVYHSHPTFAGHA